MNIHLGYLGCVRSHVSTWLAILGRKKGLSAKMPSDATSADLETSTGPTLEHWEVSPGHEVNLMWNPHLAI